MKQAFTKKLTAVLLSISVIIVACDNAGDNDPPDAPMEPAMFDRAAMLANLGNNLIVPSYQAFGAAVDDMQSAVATFAADPTTGSLDQMRAALKAARLSWQNVSMFQFGPAETVALRGLLNTYPTNMDKIEENISSGTYVLGTIENIPAGGFPAMDYLMHGNEVSDDALLALFTSDANAANRLKYLTDNADFIKSNADFVVNEWNAGGGNYIATYLGSEKGGSDVGSSLGETINAMVLHFERFTRDGKIGIPAGVRSAGVPRPKTTEAFYGGYSIELAAENLAAIKKLYTGAGFSGQEGIGLQENLEFLEATDLAGDIASTMDQSLDAINGLADPLKTQIDADVDKVVSAFTTMQDLVVLLKVDMTSLLGITITFQDNDGD